MDRNYIESEQIVERYLAGDLTVREAREFEKFCLEDSQFLNSLPIPVRLKARLARRPLDDSETGMFQAIPSSATHVVLAAAEESFEPEADDTSWSRSHVGGLSSRWLVLALALMLMAALGGLVAFGMRANSLEEQLRSVNQSTQAIQMRAPGSVQSYRLTLSRVKPEAPTLALGWPDPPQMLDLHIDMKQGKHNTFQVTIDRADGGRVMQIRRLAYDSNKELRFAINSSAFGPGDYLLRFDGYTWRGQTEEVGWVKLGLQ